MTQNKKTTHAPVPLSKIIPNQELCYEVFADREINTEVVKHLQLITEDFNNKAKQTKENSAILAKLVKHNRSLADHSVNVANIAIYLAMALGHALKLAYGNYTR